MISLRQGLLAAFLLVAPAAVSLAHEGSTSYLTVIAESGRLEGRFDVALVDLAGSLPLDRDADGRLTWYEIQAGRPGIAALLASGLAFDRGEGRCETLIGEPWLTGHLGLAYLSVDLAGRCPGDAPLTIASSLFFDLDDSHRALVSMTSGQTRHLATLSPTAPRWSEPAVSSGWRTAIDFAWQGMWHVWIGYDHLLFLLLLLLPAVARRGEYTAARSREVLLDLLRVVTAFTIAHSITLGLAATSILRLPQGPIEVAIAASIVVAAILNLAPRFQKFRLPLAFGFGLVHGFGFANALAGLGTDGAGRLPVLAGFNIGVEIANVAVIAAVLPFLLRAGRQGWYQPRALPALSLAAAAIGTAWVLQRV